MKNIYWAIAFKKAKPGSIKYPWIAWQLQVFENRKYAKKKLNELYKDISKHLKIVKVRLTQIKLQK